MQIKEFVTAAYVLGLIQATLVALILSIVAGTFYGFNILNLGVYAGLLFANLMIMGWALGMVSTALIVRWGPQAEVLAWAVPFVVQPVSAVFYPVSVLPQPLQVVANLVPAAHVFEGMRAVMTSGAESAIWAHIGSAFVLNIVYLVGAGALFRLLFEQAREKGLLAKYCS